MRALLIYPDLQVHVNYPIGLGIISALLQKQGHETRVLHFNEEVGNPLDLGVLERHIAEFEPQLVAFSSVSNQFRYVKEMAEFIKGKWDVPILLGGIHATIAPQKVLALDYIDMICVGEGELALIELLEKLEKGEDCSDIQNIGLKHNGSIKVNPVRPLIDLPTFNELPFPDRKGFNFGKIVDNKQGWANLMAGRGCLFQCTYCVNHFFHNMYAQHHKRKDNLRYRDVDVVVREIEEMVASYPNIRLINIDDDNVTLNKPWLEEFCDEFVRRIGKPFSCNVHPATFDEKIARKLADAGCVETKIGLESGSDRLRREVLKRPMEEEVIIKAFKHAEEAGIRAWSFNMVGLPTETKEEILMTAGLNAKIRPYIVRCSVFFPFEGTDLYNYSIENKLIQEEKIETVSSYLEDSVLEMPQISRDEIVKSKTLFRWHVDAQSDIEAASLFRDLIKAFERLPVEAWRSGEAQKLFEQVDASVDRMLREAKMDHYTTRHHLNLNFTAKLNFELP
ncbi:B12-binding domain-containing radical SAM protein [Thermodesulfobacteriota bacterium]